MNKKSNKKFDDNNNNDNSNTEETQNEIINNNNNINSNSNNSNSNSNSNSNKDASNSTTSASSNSSVISSPENINNNQKTTEMTINNSNNINEQQLAMASQIHQHQQQTPHIPYYYSYPGAGAAYTGPLDLNSAANWQAMTAATIAMAAVNDPISVAAYINPNGYPTPDLGAYDQFSFGYPTPTFSFGYSNLDYTHANPALIPNINTNLWAGKNSNKSMTTSPVMNNQQINNSSDPSSNNINNNNIKWTPVSHEAIPVQHLNDFQNTQQQPQLSPIDSYQNNYRNFTNRLHFNNRKNNNYVNNNNNNNNNLIINKIENDFNLMNLNDNNNPNNTNFKNQNYRYQRKLNYNPNFKYQNKKYNQNFSNNSNNNNNNNNYEQNNQTNQEPKNFVNDFNMNEINTNSLNTNGNLSDENSLNLNNKSDSKTWASIVGYQQNQQNNQLDSYQLNVNSKMINYEDKPSILNTPQNIPNEFSSYYLPDNYKNNYKPKKYNFNNNYNPNQQKQHQQQFSFPNKTQQEFVLNNGAFPPINSNGENFVVENNEKNLADFNDYNQEKSVDINNTQANSNNYYYKRQQYNNYQKQQQKQFGANSINLVNRNNSNNNDNNNFQTEFKSQAEFNNYKLENYKSIRYSTNIDKSTEKCDDEYYYRRHQPSQLNISSFMSNLDKKLFIENNKNEANTSNNNTNDKNDYQVNIDIKSHDLDIKSYNPIDFNTSPKSARFFVIKSYSEDDVYKSIKYNVWCSTEHGNRRLDSAYSKGEGNTPVYLFFSVNGSGHFCGMAEMTSKVDYNRKTDLWSQDKWRGCFQVKWIYVKDVPNSLLRNIKLENNDNRPVTNSRDTQEIPFDKGKQVLKVFHSYNHSSSIFDDFEHYEKRQDVDHAQNDKNLQSEIQEDSNQNSHGKINDISTSSISSPYSNSSCSSNSTSHMTNIPNQAAENIQQNCSQFQQSNLVSTVS